MNRVKAAPARSNPALQRPRGRDAIRAVKVSRPSARRSEAFDAAPTRRASGRDRPVEALRKAARTAEASACARASTLSLETHPSSIQEGRRALLAALDAWKGAVRALTQRGEWSAPEVKSFASKLQQAALLRGNLPESAVALHGPAYRAAVERELSTLFTDPPSALLGENPLLLVPGLPLEPSVDGAQKVRSDVVMVFCPGVVRTGEEFQDQQRAAAELGLASVRAETGTFHDAELNAEDVALAVKRAKERVGNPAAKVVLVGYSQGATNILAFMRDKAGAFESLRKDVSGIHLMHPAAGGSQLADLAYALGRYLFSDAPPSRSDQHLLRCYYQAKADLLGAPAGAVSLNERIVHGLRGAFRWFRAAWRSVKPSLKELGLDFDEVKLRQRLVGWMERQEDWPRKLASRGGLARRVALKLEPAWDQLRNAYRRSVLTNPELNGLLNVYVNGGMKSLTTDYARKLTADPRLHENLRGVPVLNSVGAVPADRVSELVPRSQRLNVAFFKRLGLESDYQVSVDNQRLANRLPTAVDLPTEAIGHWGVAGLIVAKDHPARYFQHFSPAGLVRAAASAFHALGVL